MTLRELEDRVLEHFNASTDDKASAARQRVRGHINQWHRRILSQPGFEMLRFGTLTASSTANVATLALPATVDRVLTVRDTANRRTLKEKSFDWYRRLVADPSVELGTPAVFVRQGDARSATLAAAGGVWAVSSVSTDTFRLYLEGTSSTGLKTVSVALSGTARVQVGSDTDWLTVSPTLERASTGTVSLYDAPSSGNVVASIPAGQTRLYALSLALVPTPSAALTYTIDYLRRLLPLVHESDVPWLPDDYHWLLEQGAKVQEYERTEDERLTYARRELETGLSELRRWVSSAAVLVPGGGAPIGVSSLGAWFPADTWVR